MKEIFICELKIILSKRIILSEWRILIFIFELKILLCFSFVTRKYLFLSCKSFFTVFVGKKCFLVAKKVKNISLGKWNIWNLPNKFGPYCSRYFFGVKKPFYFWRNCYPVVIRKINSVSLGSPDKLLGSCWSYLLNFFSWPHTDLVFLIGYQK